MLHAAAADRNALHPHGGFHAGQAAEDHGRVHVAQVAYAEAAPRQRTQAARDRNLELLARDRTQGFRVNAGGRPTPW